MGRRLFRMHIKPATKESDLFEFCMKNGIVGSGWRLKTEVPTDLNDYVEKGRQLYLNRNFTSMVNRYKEMRVGDLIWVRNKGIYYICEIRDNKQSCVWQYWATSDGEKYDIGSYVNVNFKKVGTIDKVPGKIVDCFRSSRAIQKIHDETMLLYTEKLCGLGGSVVCLKEHTVFDFLQPEDMEELISLYLQVEKNCLVYTSTNKLDTAMYEFVATTRDGKEKFYPQVKTGDVSLNCENYEDIIKAPENKVCLFALSERYENYDKKKHDGRIILMYKNEIEAFMHEHKQLLPKRISSWMDIVNEACFIQ